MPLAGYVQFAATHRRFIGFGFAMAFASSFGQTYFIGIFGPSVQQEFGLSHTAWGSIYMIGTLASALVLPWTGKQIDRLNLLPYTLLACSLLIIACMFVTFTTGVLSLTIAIFLLRQSGQGLMSHVAITSMARYFDKQRGRAIAIATIGFAVGEALLPFIAVAVISIIGWRWSYRAAACFLLVVFIPSIFVFLKNHAQRHADHLRQLDDNADTSSTSVRSWTRAEVMHDRRFLMLLPGILTPSMILTSMFFHHLNLADAKQWSYSWITGSYVIYAAAVTITSLASGPLIDKYSAVRLVPYMLGPLVAAMVVIAIFDNPWTAWIYFILAGINVGIAHTAVSAIWAELYGVAHLGAIKSLFAALGVFSSALGPVIAGSLMDRGITIEQVCLLFAGYALFGAVLIRIALRSA
ncbi:MAG: MFS transporter [Gammaproteobacteria bacterium]|nr:MFS transporter [Gammaproteobacteria bacterium]